MKTGAIGGTVEVAKVGAGVLAGLIVYDKFFKSK
jgi:hypothetical protein